MKFTIVGLVLGFFFGFGDSVLSIEPIQTAVNRRIWCSDADEVVRSVTFSDRHNRHGDRIELLCSRDGRLLRRVDAGHMLLTTWAIIAIACGVCLMIGGLVVALVRRSTARR